MLTVLTLLFSALFSSTLGVRVIVDDASTAWTYTSSWFAITPSTPCSSCTPQFNPARALDGTLHDSMSIGSAQLSFTGVSIEVYTVCPPLTTGGDALGTNFSFTLDNVGDGNFVGPVPACPQYEYNYLVYARTSLSLGSHTLVIANNQMGSRANSSNLILDYAVYDDGTVPPTVTNSQSHHSFPLVAVVAPAAAAVVLLLLSITQLVWYRRSKTNKGATVRPLSGTYRSKQSSSPLRGASTIPEETLSSNPIDPAPPPPMSGQPNTSVDPGPTYTGLPMLMSPSEVHGNPTTAMSEPSNRPGGPLYTVAQAPMMTFSVPSDNDAGMTANPGTGPLFASASTSQQPALGPDPNAPMLQGWMPTYQGYTGY